MAQGEAPRLTIPATTVELEVHGRPTIQGSKRAIIHRFTGRAVVTEQMGDQLRTWREDVRAAASAHCGAFPARVPLELVAHFSLPKPVGAPKHRRTWPTGKRNDLDKLLRSTMDALTSSGLYPDDSQVVRVVATKDYPGEGAGPAVPGVVLRVSQVSEVA